MYMIDWIYRADPTEGEGLEEESPRLAGLKVGMAPPSDFLLFLLFLLLTSRLTKPNFPFWAK